MSNHGRYEPRSRARSVTVGDVYRAVTGDSPTRDRLEMIYLKLFGSVRVSSFPPEHFKYVQPSRARCEIDGVASFIREQYGEPAMRVPNETPFGYLGKMDGWVVLFTDVARGEDFDLSKNFVLLEKMQWDGRGGAGVYRGGVKSWWKSLFGSSETREKREEPVADYRDEPREKARVVPVKLLPDYSEIWSEDEAAPAKAGSGVVGARLAPIGHSEISPWNTRNLPSRGQHVRSLRTRREYEIVRFGDRGMVQVHPLEGDLSGEDPLRAVTEFMPA